MTAIVITGAGGALGRLVTAKLRETVPADELILLTRLPESLRDEAAAGADVRRADFDDPSTLARAFAGADRVLLISTTHRSTGRRVAQHRGAIDAAVAAGARQIVFTSMPGVGPGHPGGAYVQEYLQTERLLATRDIGATVLRNAPYAENLVPRALTALTTGVLTSNAGDGRAAYIARADCAAVAAAVLTTDDHLGRSYDIGGPAAFSQSNLARLLARLSGRPVAVEELDDAAYLEHLRAGGMPEPMPALLAAHHVAVRQGRFDVDPATAEQLLGRPPLELEAVLASQLAAAVS